MDGNERLVQAVIRLIVIFVASGLTALGANLTILQEAVDDPILSALVFSLGTSLITAVLKWLGGATQPVSPVAADTEGVRAGRRRAAAEPERPNIFAI